MSYLVLARKYRPKNFAEMVGQEHVVRALTNALLTQRLHHAYLFTGTRGVGKTTVSRILAKSLNCVGPDGTGGITATPCGVCQACRDIDAGRFVDYVELDAASNRGVDEISQLLEQAVYKPVVGRFKVFMIDEVHMLSNTAFNAMLKTLEEPPEYLKFVLATTDPQKVPVTVLSRCLQFNLRPMAPETISEYLHHVFAAEQLDADAGSLRLISRAAHGSMRDALSLSDQAIAYGNGKVEEAAVRQMLGSVDRSHVYQLIEALAQGNGKAVIELVDFMRLQGLAAAAALDEMATVLQRMAVLQVDERAQQADDADDLAIAALAAQMPADEVQLLYSIVLHGQEELGLASDEYAALVMVLLRLLAFQPDKAGALARGGISGQTQERQIEPSAEKKTASFERRLERQPDPQAAAAPVTKNETVSLAASDNKPAQFQPASTKDAAVTHTSQSPVLSGQITPKQAETSKLASAIDTTRNMGEGLQPLPKTYVPQAVTSAPQISDGDMPPWEENVLPEPLETGMEEEMPDAPIPAVQQSTTMRAVDSFARRDEGMTEAELDDASSLTGGADEPGSKGENLPAPTPQTDRWTAVVNALVEQEAVKALTRELALNAQAHTVSADESQWTLICARKTLSGESNQQKLAQALQQYLGHPVQLQLVSGEVHDTPALRWKAIAAEALARAHAAVSDDADVQKWLREFPGARIVPGSVKPLP